MSYTSSEVKQRWKERNYKRYEINLRYDDDTAIIDYIEKHKEQYGTTELFRRAMEMLIESGEFG